MDAEKTVAKHRAFRKPKHCKYRRLQLMHSCKNRDILVAHFQLPWFPHAFKAVKHIFARFFKCACIALLTLQVDILGYFGRGRQIEFSQMLFPKGMKMQISEVNRLQVVKVVEVVDDHLLTISPFTQNVIFSIFIQRNVIFCLKNFIQRNVIA